MRVLLVDDSNSVIAVLGSCLSALGYEVVAAENGLQAVERFQAAAPDLVLMDISMPVMDGFEAVQRIRAVESTQKWAWTPIIFLTASDTPKNLVTAIEAGGDDFLAKSAPEAVLRAKMKAMARIAALRGELARANHKLEAQTRQDGLTGLFNRRYMDWRVGQHWTEAVLWGSSFGLLMIDVDHFKKYNDSYGHLAGDDSLRAIAACLGGIVDAANVASLTRDAFAARYGGEEFAAVLPRCSKEACTQIARRIVSAVQLLRIPHIDNAEWRVATLSIGGVHVPRAEGCLAPVFRQADANLYKAKKSGRNRAELS